MTDGGQTRTCQLYVNDTVAVFTTLNITSRGYTTYRVSLCQTVRLHTIDRANPARVPLYFKSYAMSGPEKIRSRGLWSHIVS